MSPDSTTPRSATAGRPAITRTARDWTADSAFFLAAVVFAVAVSGEGSTTGTLPSLGWLGTLDPLVGGVACLALWWRRRRPVHISVALVVVSTFSEYAAGALLVSLFTVAAHRAVRTSLIVFAASVVSAVTFVLVRPDDLLPRPVVLALGLLLQGAAVGWGLFVHQRRRLVESLRDRADRAEEEARLRAGRAQALAREELAREIHDVLGHRLSLLSVHAGALQFHRSAPPEDVDVAVETIRATAHRALQDLREVVGVLRNPLGDGEVGDRPQPTLADVPDLVEESVAAGGSVDLRLDLPVGDVPATTGRTVFLVVREGLTNARKHAAGEPVEVLVTGAAGSGVVVRISNPLTVPPGPAGAGLSGLAERLAVSGGSLDVGARGGRWALTARLPWPS